ncbi:hypothetical protein TEA_002559 [Camellia sinensis var. sinensis]|uniref:DNA replication licensing factor MCM4 n=1 Tax=Camellia sinensis var. sinensis TaxID=542762 RepID=A0A4S4DGU8_CAMSN|nr:hypothetical protein TEA_002559 [Camellia sinensis var. sinensis]
MSDSARSMLHEVMEQQTVSIAKAGIIASLNARTSVLACANPSGSRYNPRLSVIDNIHLPPTLLSRFDLIYLILDKADEQTDRRLAKHIVALHFENPETSQEDALDLPTLTAYVSYARNHIHPQLSDEAAEQLTRGYVEMRRRGNFPGSSKKVITATPRQIESLIRLSEALARIRFSELVEKKDVMEAFRLLEVALQQSATDHSTGTIGMDLITTGVSASERMRRENLLSATRNISMEKMQIGGASTRFLELLEELASIRASSGLSCCSGPDFASPPSLARKKLLTVLSESGKASTLIDNISIVKRYASESSHAIPVSSDDKALLKASKEVTNKKVHFVWAHFSELNSYFKKQAEDTEKVNGRLAEMISLLTCKKKSTSRNGIKYKVSSELKDILSRLDARIQCLHSNLPTNAIIVICTGHGDTAIVHRLRKMLTQQIDTALCREKLVKVLEELQAQAEVGMPAPSKLRFKVIKVTIQSNGFNSTKSIEFTPPSQGDLSYP